MFQKIKNHIVKWYWRRRGGDVARLKYYSLDYIALMRCMSRVLSYASEEQSIGQVVLASIILKYRQFKHELLKFLLLTDKETNAEES